LSQIKNTAVHPAFRPSPQLVQQISVLHMRISDLAAQLDTVMKTMTDENEALRKENAELKAKQ
jgi:regulator of replication initiation timing